MPHDNKPWLQLEENLPREWSRSGFLDEVERKGNRKGTHWSEPAGNGTIGGCEAQISVQLRSGLTAPTSDVEDLSLTAGSTPLVVPFQSGKDSCVPFALLNVLGSSQRDKRKLVKAFGSPLGGFRDLAAISQPLLGKSLQRRTMTLDDLTQGYGMYLVMDGVLRLIQPTRLFCFC